MFDFDGTLSLLREGWAGIMAEIGLGLLTPILHVPRARIDWRHRLEREMLMLSGKPSLQQMKRLAEIAKEEGLPTPGAEHLLAIFDEALMAITADRKRRIQERLDPPAAWAVHGAREILTELQKRGVELYLASGTVRQHVIEEAHLLDVAEFFPERIFAPESAGARFSKQDVLEQMLRNHGLSGHQILGFGDGYSETVEVKRVGGVAVGLATAPVGEVGPHSLKRTMLLELGADLIIPNYRDAGLLVDWLWG
jgi:phosphoglycolate phosphatase-like HAD superfamily hydrolase